MHPLIVIAIAFLVVWLDIAIFAWVPIALTPIWVWVGIHLTVLRNNDYERWLWVASVAVWSLFSCSWLEGLVLLLVFLVGSVALNYINKRYLPMTNVLLTLVPSTIILAFCQIAYTILTKQSIATSLAGRVVVTMIIICVMIIFYDPKKTKKKHIRTSR